MIASSYSDIIFDPNYTTALRESQARILRQRIRFATQHVTFCLDLSNGDFGGEFTLQGTYENSLCGRGGACPSRGATRASLPTGVRANPNTPPIPNLPFGSPAKNTEKINKFPLYTLSIHKFVTIIWYTVRCIIMDTHIRGYPQVKNNIGRP